MASTTQILPQTPEQARTQAAAYSRAFMDAMSPTAIYERIVDRHTRTLSAEQVDLIERLTAQEVNVLQISNALDIDVADVLAALDSTYYCAGCWMARDLGVGVRCEGYWGTPCHGAYFLNAKGNEYLADPREEAEL